MTPRIALAVAVCAAALASWAPGKNAEFVWYGGPVLGGADVRPVTPAPRKEPPPAPTPTRAPAPAVAALSLPLSADPARREKLKVVEEVRGGRTVWRRDPVAIVQSPQGGKK
jgi:hypothetical protein